MKVLKHSKLKNTAIIFEILSRKLISEVMSNSNGEAFKIIKQHFNSNSILYKELGLYKSLVESKELRGKNESYAQQFIDSVLGSRRTLSNKDLKNAKYRLIKTIKETYGDEFLQSNFNLKIPKYRELASVYKLFEYETVENPSELMSCRIVVGEALTQVPEENPNITWSSLSKGVRMEAFKTLLERFNEKYKGFTSRQKDLLRAYINYPEKFKDIMHSEIIYLESHLKSLELTDDKAISIKLHEIRNQLADIKNQYKITDSHISAVLKTHTLINELKK